MVSGHVNRANRSNTWLPKSATRRKSLPTRSRPHMAQGCPSQSGGHVRSRRKQKCAAQGGGSSMTRCGPKPASNPAAQQYRGMLFLLVGSTGETVR
jgi:hypothetical protein